MMTKQFAGVAFRTWWVLVIVIPLCTLVLWIALDRTNAAQDRALEHSNQQFRRALIVTDRKFRQALRIQTALFAYSTNKSVCGFRDLAKGSLKSALSGEHDPRLPPAIQQRNHAIVIRTRAFLETQVTVPSDFDCKTLPKNPPKPPGVA